MQVMLFVAMLATTPVERLLESIEHVESNHNPRAIGDRGGSRGSYQISRAYHKDSGVPGDYMRVHEREYARRVVMAYWKRWCPDALKRGDLETLARVHNGGPRGETMKATRSYWNKIRKEMRR